MKKKILLPSLVLVLYSFDCRVEIPPANKDSAPVITIGVANKTRNTSQNHTSDKEISVDLGTKMNFISSAYNGGGVLNHILSISSTQQTILRTSQKDAQGKVPKQLNIIADDANIPIQISFNSPGQIVIVKATSENYNFMQSNVTLTFKTAFPPPKIDYLKFTKRLPPHGNGEEDGYVPIGQSTNILWNVLNCSSGCNITLTATTAPDGLNWNNTVFTATGLPALGSRLVTPAEFWTKYVLTVYSPWGSTSKEVIQQLAQR